MSLKWKDPPPDRSRGRWDAIADELRAHPNEWAFLGNIWVSTVGSIKKGSLRAFRPAGAFEATCRHVNQGKADVYVRYVGTPTTMIGNG